MDGKKIILYKFPTVGPSTSFRPLVTVEGYKHISGEDAKRFHELMGELKYECLKLKIHFEGSVYKFEDFFL